MSSYQLISKPIVVDERMKRMIAGAIAEVDPAQIAIRRSWTLAERVRQAAAMIKGGERAAAYRLRQSNLELSEAQALRAVRLRNHKKEEYFKKWRRKS